MEDDEEDYFELLVEEREKENQEEGFLKESEELLGEWGSRLTALF